MSAVYLHAAKGRLRLVRQLTIKAVCQHFREAQHRIEGRAQLVAHICKELGFVPAGNLELSTLLLDLTKQTRILNGQHRLCSECFKELHCRFGKPARCPAPHDESTDRPVRS